MLRFNRDKEFEDAKLQMIDSLVNIQAETDYLISELTRAKTVSTIIAQKERFIQLYQDFNRLEILLLDNQIQL